MVRAEFIDEFDSTASLQLRLGMFCDEDQNAIFSVVAAFTPKQQGAEVATVFDQRRHAKAMDVVYVHV